MNAHLWLQHSKIVEKDGKMFFILIELQLFFMITSICSNVLLIIVVCQEQVVLATLCDGPS